MFKNLYLLSRFYYITLSFIGLFFISFLFPKLYYWVWAGLVLFIGFSVWDYIQLFLRNRNGFQAVRLLPKKFSNGDANAIELNLQNQYPFRVHYELIDEIPFQFQKRDFSIKRKLDANQSEFLTHYLTPVGRGVYQFGKLNVFIHSNLKLVSRRYDFSNDQEVSCYPSFIQMKETELHTFTKNKMRYGSKKIRKIGNTLEFEQIRNYVIGDNIRSINWKATAKSNQLMLNQFQDETQQSVYIVLDKGRTMQMPFNGMTLLDYAINTSLALSNIILKKNDKVGLMTYSNTVERVAVLSAEKFQLKKIMEALYNVTTEFKESDYGKLYAHVKHSIPHRSLLLLFTNFETLEGMKRQLPYLRALAKSHVVLIIFFENTEVTTMASQEAVKVEHIFDKITAAQFKYDKKLIFNELQKYGLHPVVSKPEELSMHTINKYLEIKARGLL